jgi:hypothetical protein
MDYLETLKSINYFSFVTAFVKWIFLFLAISIILLIVCRRIGLFKRRTKTARYLVKIYYILIPIYFIVFAIKLAPIKTAQNEINNLIDKNKAVISNYTFKFANSMVSDSILAQKSSAKEIVGHYLEHYVSKMDSLTEPKTNEFFEGFFTKIKRKIEYGFLIKIVESKAIEQSAKWIGISEKTEKTLYRTNFNKLFHEGELVELYKIEVNRYFRSYFRFTFLIFTLGLLIPTIEIILAKIFKY